MSDSYLIAINGFPAQVELGRNLFRSMTASKQSANLFFTRGKFPYFVWSATYQNGNANVVKCMEVHPGAPLSDSGRFEIDLLLLLLDQRAEHGRLKVSRLIAVEKIPRPFAAHLGERNPRGAFRHIKNAALRITEDKSTGRIVRFPFLHLLGYRNSQNAACEGFVSDENFAHGNWELGPFGDVVTMDGGQLPRSNRREQQRRFMACMR